MRLSHEIRNAVSLRRALCGGRACGPKTAWSTGTAGVEEHGKSTEGFPRNVRDLAHPRPKPGWRNRVNNSRPDPRFAGHGSEMANQAWYRCTKETECSEKCGQESHRPIVPMKRGNSSRGNPVEERGKWCHSVFGTCGR